MADLVADAVTAAFVEAVGMPPPHGLSTTQNDVAAWDSLANVHLVLAIESRLGITLPDDLLVERLSLGDIVAAAQSAAARVHG